jgi:hypothetical protein
MTVLLLLVTASSVVGSTVALLGAPAVRRHLLLGGAIGAALAVAVSIV